MIIDKTEFQENLGLKCNVAGEALLPLGLQIPVPVCVFLRIEP
jgi:hypothetical protein